MFTDTIAARHAVSAKQSPRTFVYMLAFAVVIAFTYNLEKRTEMALQNIEIDYN